VGTRDRSPRAGAADTIPAIVGEDPTKVRRSKGAPARGQDDAPCLEVVEGHARGTRYWLEGPKTVLGRSARADIELLDEGISREHARITVDADGIVGVVDLGSTNGTFVNDAPIDAAVVRAGDRIRLGPDVTLQFWWRSRVGAADTSHAIVELSARELEIARLVAEGLTNGEIADRLGISPHTVMTHLSNVFTREGLASRAELAGVVASDRVRLVARSTRRAAEKPRK